VKSWLLTPTRGIGCRG